MHCSVYKGRAAPEYYLFLPCRDDFSGVLQDTLNRFGPLEHVMDLVLTPGRRLERTEAVTLMRTLLIKGCYIQLPPRELSGVSAATGSRSP